MAVSLGDAAGVCWRGLVAWFGVEIVEGAVMLYIAIGRNIGDKPMPEEQWLQLQNEVIYAVGKRPDTIAHGRSFWRSDSEDTCVFVWFGVDWLGELSEARLRDLAGDFGQDAIAWIAGETQFAEPWKK